MNRTARLEVLAWGALLVGACTLLAWYCNRIAFFVPLSVETTNSLAYARTLAEVGSSRLAWGGPVEEGFSSALWLALQVALLGVGAPARSVVLLVSWALGPALVFLAGTFGALANRRPPRLEDVLPAVALALSDVVARTADDGSEVGAFSFAVLAVALVMMRSFAAGRARLAGVALGALTLVRPEAVVLVPPTVVAWWLASRLESAPGRRASRELVALAASALFVLALVWGARFLVFADVWPRLPAPVAEDAGAFVARHANWVWASIGGLLVAVVWRRFHAAGTGLVALWAISLLAASALLPNAARVAEAALPLLVIIAGAGVSAARDALRLENAPPRGLAWASLCVVSVTLASTTMTRRPAQGTTAPRPAPVAGLAAELRARGVERPWVAAEQPLALAEVMRNAQLVPIRPGAQVALLDDRLASEGPPDLVVAAALADGGMPRVLAALEPSDGGVPAWWLRGQSQDEDVRCPDGKLALVGLTPDLLVEQLERDLGAGQAVRALKRWVCAVAHLPAEQLPSPRQRERVVELALSAARDLEAQGQLEAAVRHLSLATLLEDDDPHLRRRTERMRARWLLAGP